MNSFTIVNDTNKQGEEELRDDQQHEDEETKTSPSKPPATAFTISFDDDGNNDEGRKSLGIRDSIRQFAPRKSFARSSRRSTRSTPATSYGAEEDSIESNHTMNSLPLTDSAAYLINKMFSSEEPSPESPAQHVDLCQDVSVLHHHTNGATREDIKELDALSEAGTYTLGVEQKNDALEHARKMIDNVFGVHGSKPPAFTSTTTFSKKKVSPGSVPSSPKPSRASAGTATGSNSNLSGSGDGENDLRQRTFTRTKSRRSSLDTQSNHGNSSRGEAASSSSFERSYRMKPSSSPSHTAVTTTHQSSSSKSARRNRLNSFSSSKSSGSNKTVDVKKPTQFTNSQVSNSRYSSLESPRMQRKSSSLERGKGDSSESLASFDSDGRVKDTDANNSSSSGLKLNRAFALRRARLGIETPGVSVTLTDEKQKKNQEKRARDERNFIAARSSAPSTSSFSRDDGGRFSLRVTRGKPPLPGSCPATPTRKPRDLSQRKVQQHHQTQQGGRFDLVRLSPASSTNSIPNNNSYQRRGSFGPHPPQSDHHSSLSSHSREISERLREMRGLNAFQVSKRMFSTKPYQQQQVCPTYDMRGNKQQANVAPMKRTPCVQQPNLVEPPSHLPQVMTSSFNEQSIRSEPVTGTYASQEGAGATCNSRPQAMIQRRMLSSLDNLVVSAILQLSLKIRRGMREWLESEKLKHPTGSETRLMIEEILPQVSNIEPPTPMSSFDNSLSSCNESLSKDLSSILKNLKKVEQSMEGKCDFYFVHPIFHSIDPI